MKCQILFSRKNKKNFKRLSEIFSDKEEKCLLVTIFTLNIGFYFILFGEINVYPK